MKYLRLYLLLIVTLISIAIKAQEIFVLPFFDGFEETISNDATFTKWTTENLQGWHYWHLIPGGGVPGQCMRFENTELAQNDWLITRQITGENIENILIRFDVFHFGQGVKPKLLYTSQYNGDASASSWTEINYSLGENENEWYNTGDIIIENPGNTLFFAFHYEAARNEGIYILIDNFKVQSYVPVKYELAGSSDHFEFYTNMTEASDYWLEIKDILEVQYEKLSALWNRPGIEDIFNDDDIIKVYYSEREFINQVDAETPQWKCGFHDAENLTLFLARLSSTSQVSFYSDLQTLAKNEFSQLAVAKKFMRNNYDNLPPHFLEGFGLYESGFRPRRDSVIKYLTHSPVPDFNFISDTTGICSTLKRDLIVSNIEGQILSGWSYLAVGPGASTFIAKQWPAYLKYYYTEPENKRIKLLISTTDFDFYGAISDSSHFSEIVSYFENAYSFYIEKYKYKPEHRFNVVIVPTETIGMQLLNYDDYFNGGVGCGGDLVIELSPNYNYDAQIYYSNYFGYDGMSAHEFFHVFYNHFMWNIPGGFWAEGTADFSARHALGWEIPAHSLWEIDWMFKDYAKEYNVVVNLAHISTNPYLKLDIYFLGDMFFEYIFKYHGGYEKIREFFNAGMDYSVFNATYSEIDDGYINYLKGLVNSSTLVKHTTASDNMLKVCPNPLTDISTITFTNILTCDATLEIYDLKGQKLFTIVDDILLPGTHTYQINRSQLPGGLYIVSLSTPLNRSYVKIVITDN